jgi:hypothetical protein
MLYLFKKKLLMASGVVFKPSPWGILLYEGRAAGFEPELVKLAALPRYQWAIPTLVKFIIWNSTIIIFKKEWSWRKLTLIHILIITRQVDRVGAATTKKNLFKVFFFIRFSPQLF